MTAGWALFGKRPGSSDDYGVLTSSREPFTPAGFTRILRRYAVGTPPAHRSGEDALPWVTISWVGEAPDRYLGMAIQDWSDHRDGAGRPVAFTKYVCIPYKEVAEAPVSYTALYRALLRVELPMDGPDHDRITLNAPEYAPSELARDIDRFGRTTVMRTAALLLDGRADVLHAGDASLADRLAFLDAVAALLPYGYRADFTAATWATGAADKIRFAFTRRARDGAREVSWRGAAEPGRLSATAENYLRKLADLLARGRDLPWLVAYLADDIDPRDFNDPGHALQRLADLEWPRELAESMQRGVPGMASDVRRLLRGTRLQELPAADQARALCYVLREGDPDDLQLAELRWDQLVATASTEMTEALSDGAANLLWRDEPDGRVSRYVRFAAQRRFADEFLAGLIRHAKTDRSPGTAAAGRKMAAELLRDHVNPMDSAWGRSRVLGELGQDAPLAAALLASENAGRERVKAWVAWLHPVFPDFLAPYRELLGDREVNGTALRKLADAEPEWVMGLLHVAGRLGKLEPVLPGILRWACEYDEMDTRAHALLTGALMSMRTEEAGGQGAIDALLLLLGMAPRFLPDASGRADSAVYQNGFVWTWTRGATPTKGRTLIRGLTTALRQRPWEGSPDRADAVINLARALLDHGSGHDWSPLATVLATDPPEPELVSRPAYGELRRLLAPYDTARAGAAAPTVQDEYRAPASAPAIPANAPALSPNASPAELADFYVKIALESSWSSAATALEALTQRGRWLNAAEAYELMELVQYAVAHRYDRQQADRQVCELAKAVVGGALGPGTAAEFRDALADAASQEAAHQAELLEIAGLDVPGQASWEMPPQSRTRLEERVTPVLDRVLKQGRGGRFGWVRRG
ncbi:MULTISPECIES: hypothetical protein [Actinomadura]|uniref:Uncharacterized protein n=1 Tax=Actinomadura yumaensis TaxID=111807 RepID=A0ABW2CEW9_9ACTN|nr:hypothetical protein [Actinomadura sp. J1-007]MWK34659.1 hypothetical protein [Actinomadura sp. J1-007]